jgi:predicted anti-sigma-YlaC factor YlaD
MRNHCEIVTDLLPLYVEEVISQQGQQYVEAHLKTCQFCQQKHHEYVKTRYLRIPFRSKPHSSATRITPQEQMFIKRIQRWRIMSSVAGVTLVLLLIGAFWYIGNVSGLTDPYLPVDKPVIQNDNRSSH